MPTTSPTRRDLKKARTWARIFDAASEVFGKRGFAEASLAEIASLAGVAKGSVYRHVASKADLYVEVLIARVTELRERLDAQPRGGASATESVTKLARCYRELLEDGVPHVDRLHWAIKNPGLIGPIDAQRQARGMREMTLLLTHLEDVLQDGIRRGEIADCDARSIALVVGLLAESFSELCRSPARQILLRRPVGDVFREGLALVVRGLAERELGREPLQSSANPS